ncbi:MAG: hypothetical protein BHV90_15705 [Clostridiales bacterium 42_27]|uniref:Minor tail protein n=1 Tax=Myoviridae sp. ctkOm7 TaxID=2826690 RepID=A0A8S5NNN7_9CAUD|nr:MAG: hypothetical protein BHV90_15705 [Clostridiales bacterium 42_27]DAD95683.1 MAG TPA: minor tail protein [Myoviridae sp. ctkOm7]
MNLLNLYVKLSVDTGQYDESIEKVRSSAEKVSKNFDTVGKETKKASNNFKKATGAVEKFTVATDDAGDNTKDFSKEVKDAEKNTASLSEALSRSDMVFADLTANAIAGAIKAVGNFVSSIVNLDQTTAEFREGQGKLKTAFEQSGFSADTAKQAYEKLYSVLGDTDQATEASQLLAKLADNVGQVSDWTTIATGVVGTFGDSLPVESLIEAANETAKVGTVTGTLADALNWAGVNEDVFNAQLATLNSTQERTAFITGTLNNLYADAADAYKENNSSVIKANENHLKLQETLAKIGEAVENVKSAFLEKFAPVLEDMGGKIASFIEGIDAESLADACISIYKTLNALLPVVVGIGAAFLSWQVVSTVQAAAAVILGLGTASGTAATSITALNAAIAANPIGFVITLVVGLASAIITLWKTNEGFRDAVIGIFESIKQAVENSVNFISEKIDSIKDRFGEVVTGVKNLLGIHSPSRVFAGIGENMALGLGEGWDNEYGNIKRSIASGMDFGTASVDFGTSGVAAIGNSIASGVGALATGGVGSIVINLTTELDGAVLARKMVPYNAAEALRSGV